MSIIYSIVARGSTVLAEYSSSTGNFTQITRRILDKIPQQDGKMSYVYDKHVFHYVCHDGITYLCMTEQSFSRSLAFAFLEDIKQRFGSSYGNTKRTAGSMAMNAEFSHVLQRQMDFYSNNPNADKLKQTSDQVEEVKALMTNNIEQVLERGDKIELLVDKTEGLYNNATTFKHQATSLKRALLWKNIKLTLIIVAVLIAVVLLIVTFACGIKWQKCISSNTSSAE